MIMKANKQIGFIYKDNESIDKILKDGEVVFERGFLREKASTTLPITFGGVGKDLKDYRVYGNTYQNSTSGKNLCGVPNLNTTVSGVEINIKDGIITLNGTATGAIFYYINPINTTILNGGYTLNNIYVSGDVSSTGTKNFNIRRADDQSNIFSNGFVQSNSYRYNNFSENVEIIFGIYCTNGTVFNNYKFIPQLVVGTEPDYDYESYTGGQPSPNPDYPQEIISCGDRTKNLFDKANATYKNGYYKNDNGVEQTTNQSGYLTSYVSVKPNTTYTIQGSLKQTNQSTHIYALYYYDINKNWIYRTTTTDNPPYTFTTPNDCYFIQFQYRQDAYDEDTIQIEEGSTATSYEPYGYKIPVNVRSENLFDITKPYVSENLSTVGVTLTLNDDGTITVNGTNNASYKYIRFDVELEAGVYYFSGCPSGGERNGYSMIIQTGSATSTQVFDTGEGATFTLTEKKTIQFFPVRVGLNTVTFNNMVFKPMIAKIPVSYNDYQSYYNQTTNIYLYEPLRKIDGYSDYIDFKNSKVVRNIEEIVLDGNENWFINGSGTNRWFYYVDNLTKNTPSDNGKYIISSHYIGNAIYSSNTNKGIVATKSSKELRIRYGVEDTIANFKTWLQSNNVTVNYVLATPTEENIELPNIPTVDGNNTLNIETEITPSQVYIKYKSNT